ncbi:type II toxin-antitoxin system RelE/ParE family toxin [Ruegeria sp.]|uniref:type II toxin-antitoxin system RelE/ParE family toxin n=1 Tax=Ruegeria sp. TaxID=1879320 RepID=UPI003C7A1EC3
MNYRLSAKAEADLIQIYVDGVQDFGVMQAEAYQDKIDQAIELIAENPEMARLRDEITPPVRIHPVHAHAIIYLVDDNRMVRILRVRHGRENWPDNPIG